MSKILVFGALVACATMLGATIDANAAEASPESAPPDLASPLTMGRSLANAPYLSSTGQTVPRPSQLPSSSQPGQDRQIHDRDDLLIRKGICSNC
ncbi:hypothetical protein RZS28_14270 [Methylocapsa polymorpha]|uniref:Uncharacterized protein n=1 Tax=Methylocapsa polymorpha TaxID=3080828 RepID=A0ABZ0HNT8_9HYPH|nr:hypothetical protein RZS28_14270 [Methylocapsa sp. RX1]